MLSMLSKNKLYVHSFSIIICLVALFSQSACHIHRIDVRQGNEIEQDKLEQLKPRLTKKEVQQILGTTTLDPININRLDYYYSTNPNQDGITKQQHIILYFDNNGELNHYEGDFVLKNLPTTTKNKKKQN